MLEKINLDKFEESIRKSSVDDLHKSYRVARLIQKLIVNEIKMRRTHWEVKKLKKEVNRIDKYMDDWRNA
jgi:hypothetical protein